MPGLLHLSEALPRVTRGSSSRTSQAMASWRPAHASFSTTRRGEAPHAAGAAHPLAFPSHKRHPTPLDIFHLGADADFSPRALKSRYYELCRLYHPDLQKGKERADSSKPKDTSSELKQINLAYEILRNPTKRNIYLRSGIGWGSPGQHRRHGPATNPGYDFTRGRPMSSSNGAWRGPYPSAAWDWADPHSTHFRPGFGGGTGDGAAGAGGGSAAGWQSSGRVGSNGVVFLALCSFTLFLTPLTLWSATPSMGDTNDESLGLMVGDRRHREAARALEQARREARDGGKEKREAIARRVRQIERERAYERAMQVQRTAYSGETGHTGSSQQLALPPPSSAGRSR